MTCCSHDPSRRTFLAAGGLATAAVALTSCSSEPEQDLFSGGTLTKAIELESLPVGSAVQMIVGSQQLLIFRESQDLVHAYSAVCTHQGCIVGASENDPTEPFICPCHASRFDKTSGEAIAGPAQLPLTRHTTDIANGWVLIEVEPV